MVEDELEKLATRLRQEGAIYGPERDLMMDAARALRTLRGIVERLRSIEITSYTAAAGHESPYEIQAAARAALTKESN